MNQGECDTCGNWSGALQEGMCPPCTDNYRTLKVFRERGIEMTPYQKAGFNELSLFRVYGNELKHLKQGDIVWLKADDDTSCPYFESANSVEYLYLESANEFDFAYIQELPKDADGYYLWDGGECPVPRDWWVYYKGEISGDSMEGATAAVSAPWDDTTAFKPISRPDMPVHDKEQFNNSEQADSVDEFAESLATHDDRYGRLHDVLLDAWAQAAQGKGNDRHATGQAFEDQPMQVISQLIGSRDGMAFQAIKKIQESQRMEKDAAIRELLGAINYIAGMVIYLES